MTEGNSLFAGEKEAIAKILGTKKFDIAKKIAAGTESIDDHYDIYELLFQYYLDHNAMDYGTAKGRTGDPIDWVDRRLQKVLG